MKKIGLLGGSFDPPHKGHLFVSMEGKKLLRLDEVWWILTPQNPLKILKPASYEERLKNCYTVTRNYPIAIKEYEHDIQSSNSYTTILHLKKKFKFFKFFWLMGADNLIFFDKWQHWKKIFNEVSIVVFKRHGYNSKALKSLARKNYENYHLNINKSNQDAFKKLPSWSFFSTKEIKISSTEIRLKRESFRGQY